MNTITKINLLLKLHPDTIIETHTAVGKHGKVEHHARVRGLYKKLAYHDFEEHPIKWYRSSKSPAKAMALAVKGFMRYNNVSLRDLRGNNKISQTRTSRMVYKSSSEELRPL